MESWTARTSRMQTPADLARKHGQGGQALRSQLAVDIGSLTIYTIGITEFGQPLCFRLRLAISIQTEIR